jgi:hypothetical protein
MISFPLILKKTFLIITQDEFNRQKAMELSNTLAPMGIMILYALDLFRRNVIQACLESDPCFIRIGSA